MNFVKIWKFRWLNSEHFYDEMKNDFSLEVHRKMIYSQNKQFLMPSHKDGRSYCLKFLNKTFI